MLAILATPLDALCGLPTFAETPSGSMLHAFAKHLFLTYAAVRT